MSAELLKTIKWATASSQIISRRSINLTRFRSQIYSLILPIQNSDRTFLQK